MKFWKKQIFSLLAALAVLLTLVPQRAEAASCGLSGAGSVRAGNTVTVTFSISGGDILGLIPVKKLAFFREGIRRQVVLTVFSRLMAVPGEFCAVFRFC